MATEGVDRDGSTERIRRDVETLSGPRYTRMRSRAAHGTMSIAGRVPSAMVFVPCKDEIGHSPEEESLADAALGAEIMLGAIVSLSERS